MAPPIDLRRFIRRNPTIVIGAVVLTVLLVIAVLAPFISGDPQRLSPIERLRPPSAQHWFGTDNLGRDVFARTVWGGRVSLLVGFCVAAFATLAGIGIGLLCYLSGWVEAVAMRIMDGLMAIPSILLAIALVSLTRASVATVIIAITIPEIPRVTRLVRAVMLGVRERPFVEAATAGGSRPLKIMWRHILPATIPPLIVQATYSAASAILIEAGLSFLGAGTPPSIPTWGNMIAGSRVFLSAAPWAVFFPGVSLAVAVLAVNILGDGLRDRLDPRLSRRM
jgi:peptide/nickel transport system permease protein